MAEDLSVINYRSNGIPQSVNGLKVKPNVGLLNAPDSHYRPILFSPLDAKREHIQLNHDVWEESQPYKPKKKKIPTSVWIILGGAILAFPVAKLIKKLFR